MRNKKGQFVKGHKLSKSHKLKLSETLKLSWKNGKLPPMMGKKHSATSIEKMKRKTPWNKGLKNWRIGYKNSKKTREKIRQSRLGKKLSKETIEKIIKSRKGYRHSYDTKRKISESHRGEKCYLWKGGRTLLSSLIKHSFKYRNWRLEIFERDNYTCQECEERGGELHPHHIKSFSRILTENNIKTLEEAIGCEELWEVSNGITLCRNCHKLTDSFAKNYAYQSM